MKKPNTIFNEAEKHHLSGKEWEAELLVAQKNSASEGVIELILTDPSGADLPRWTPGAHIDLLMSNGMVRQYSLCGDMNDPTYYRIGILCEMEGRGGSKYIHEELQTGQKIGVRGPRNHFPLVKANSYLFIAGGIGITPIIPMIQAVHKIGADWRLIYGGRTEKSMAFRNELSEYGDKVQLFPADSAGFLPLDRELSETQESLHIYTCGPERLLDAVETKTADWPEEHVHSERFSAKTIDAPENAIQQFEVECKRSNITVQVGADESILAAIEAKGVKVMASCRAGVCGTCEVDILEGQADHRDTVLSKSEKESNEFMLVCCSRSLSEKLVLDI